MMPQLSTPSSRFYLPRWALPHIPNHDDPTDQILFFDPTNKRHRQRRRRETRCITVDVGEVDAEKPA